MEGDTMTTTPIVGSSTDARVRYQGFDALYVGGVWRSGGAGQYTDDLDPWTGRSIARIARGTVEDVQEALESAKDAQRGWAKTSPGLRAQVMRTAGDILTSRKQEFIDWSVREVGSTVGKAEVEWEVARGEVYEAASMSYHVTGQILPSDVPGKENRVYRAPLGSSQ